MNEIKKEQEQTEKQELDENALENVAGGLLKNPVDWKKQLEERLKERQKRYNA